MKFNHFVIYLLFITITLIVSSLGGVESQTNFTDPLTNHNYSKIGGNFTYYNASTYCQSLQGTDGTFGYLAVITSDQEFDLVASYISTRTWVAGTNIYSNTTDAYLPYYFDQGPEIGTLMFDPLTGQTFSYARFPANEPNLLASERTINIQTGFNYMPNGKYMNNRNPTTILNTIICEFGGMDKPHIVLGQSYPSWGQTQPVVVTNLGGWGINQLNITGSCRARPNPTFMITYNVINITSITLAIPNTSGFIDLLFRDPSGRSATVTYQHVPPVVTALFVKSPTSTLFNFVGNNFSPYLQITLGGLNCTLSGTPTSQIATCTTDAPVPQLTPIMFSDDGIVSYLYRIPVRLESDQTFLSVFAQSIVSADVPLYLSKQVYGQMVGYSTTIRSVAQRNMVSWIVPDNGTWDFIAPVTPVSIDSTTNNSLTNDFIFDSGSPYSGQHLAFPGYTAVNVTSYQGSTMYAINPGLPYFPTPAPSRYNVLVEIGGYAPSFASNTTNSISTDGTAIVTLNLKNAGPSFLRNCTVTYGFAEYPCTVCQNGEYECIKFTPNPNFSGPYPVVVTIDGRSTNTTSSSYSIDYLAPIITSVNSVSTSGTNQITFTGQNFYPGSNIVTIGSIQANIYTSTYNFIVCTVAGAGNVTGTISVGNKQTTFYYAFQPPVITSIAVGVIRLLTINGLNFGNSAIASIQIQVGGLIVPQADITTFTDTKIVAYIPWEVLAGNVTVTINSLTSNAYPFTPNTQIGSSTLAPIPSGLVTLTVYFAPPRSVTGHSIDYVFATQYGSGSYQNVSCLPHSQVHPYSFLCPSPQYSGPRRFAIKVYPTLNFGFVFFQDATIDYTTSVFYGTGGNVTIYGTNFFNPLESVTIGNHSCTNIYFISTQSIICDFDGTVPRPTISSNALDVNVTYVGMTVVRSVFFYTDTIQCPGLTNNTIQCSGHGSCNAQTGLCTCSSNYDGFDCSKFTPPPSTPPKPPIILPGANVVITTSNQTNSSNPTPSSSQQPSFNFNINIAFLRETDITGATVRILDVAREITWLNRTDSSNGTVLYNGWFNQTGVRLDVLIQLFNESTSIIFAGETLPISSNSIKYQFTISNYTFSNPLNNLELVARSSTNRKVEYDCSQVDTTTTLSSNTSSIQWFEINSGGAILKGQFSSRMIVDNRFKKTLIKVLEVADPLYKLIINSTELNATQYNLLTSINTGFFASSCVLDPNFAVLTTLDYDEKNGQCKQQPSNSSWRLIVIVVVCTIGGATIIGVTLFTIIRKSMFARTLKHKFSTKLRSFK